MFHRVVAAFTCCQDSSTPHPATSNETISVDQVRPATHTCLQRRCIRCANAACSARNYKGKMSARKSRFLAPLGMTKGEYECKKKQGLRFVPTKGSMSARKSRFLAPFGMTMFESGSHFRQRTVWWSRWRAEAARDRCRESW